MVFIFVFTIPFPPSYLLAFLWKSTLSFSLKPFFVPLSFFAKYIFDSIRFRERKEIYLFHCHMRSPLFFFSQNRIHIQIKGCCCFEIIHQSRFIENYFQLVKSAQKNESKVEVWAKATYGKKGKKTLYFLLPREKYRKFHSNLFQIHLPLPRLSRYFWQRRRRRK